MGIVGLPNVGKSTLFNVLTKLSIPAENFPFCTIEPNQVCAGADMVGGMDGGARRDGWRGETEGFTVVSA